MKTIIIATLICLPCLVVFSEGETFVPNILGLAYMFGLMAFAKTKKGRAFFEKAYNDCERINKKIYNLLK